MQLSNKTEEARELKFARNAVLSHKTFSPYSILISCYSTLNCILVRNLTFIYHQIMLLLSILILTLFGPKQIWIYIATVIILFPQFPMEEILGH